MNRLRMAACAITTVLAVTACNTAQGSETIAQDEAAEQAREHIDSLMGELPATAELEERGGPNVAACDDPTDGGPKDRVIVSDIYWVRGLPIEDNEHNVELMHAYWTANGYRVVHDLRPDELFLTVEHEEDAFLVSVQSSMQGSLSISASSPCVWPEGTPNA